MEVSSCKSHRTSVNSKQHWLVSLCIPDILGMERCSRRAETLQKIRVPRASTQHGKPLHPASVPSMYARRESSDVPIEPKSIAADSWICNVNIPLPLQRLNCHGAFLASYNGTTRLRVGEVSLVALLVLLYQMVGGNDSGHDYSYSCGSKSGIRSLLAATGVVRH